MNAEPGARCAPAGPGSECRAIPFGACRGVLLDYGNVLAALDTALIAAAVATSGGAGDAKAARAAVAAGYRAHDDALAAGAPHAEGWRALIGVVVAAAWGPAGGAPPARERVVERLWRRQPTRNLWRAVPEPARELLHALRAAGVRVGIVSNSEGSLLGLLDELDLLGLVGAVLDSGVVGVAKPDPAIFGLASSSIGLPLAELVHVGDSETADVGGALAAGAWAIRFDGIVPNRRPTRAHARAETFAELATLLGHALGRPLPPIDGG